MFSPTPVSCSPGSRRGALSRAPLRGFGNWMSAWICAPNGDDDVVVFDNFEFICKSFSPLAAGLCLVLPRVHLKLKAAVDVGPI